MGLLAMNEGRDGDAEADLKKAAALDPNCADAFSKLGALAARQGRHGEARQQLTKALELDPQNTEARNSLAWLLATCKDAQFRDGKKALEYALKAAEQPESPWYCLDTLAAAYAADGQFGPAAETQERAIKALRLVAAGAPSDKQKNLSDMESRLGLYKKNMPFIGE